MKLQILILEESEDTGISDYYDEDEDANYDDFNKQYEETRKRKIVTGNGMDFFQFLGVGV